MDNYQKQKLEKKYYYETNLDFETQTVKLVYIFNTYIEMKNIIKLMKWTDTKYLANNSLRKKEGLLIIILKQ